MCLLNTRTLKPWPHLKEIKITLINLTLILKKSINMTLIYTVIMLEVILWYKNLETFYLVKKKKAIITPKILVVIKIKRYEKK